MKSALTVSNRLVSRVTDAAKLRGVDVGALCRAAGIEPRALEDIDSDVEADRYLELWACAMERIGDPGFPIEAASTFSETHNLLRFVCMACENVGAALQRASRYMSVITRANRWLLEAFPEGLVVGVERSTRPGARGTGYADEYCVAEIIAFGRYFTGVEWSPLEVRFAHAEPADTVALRAFFRAPVHFGSTRTEIAIPASALSLPLRQADASVREFFTHLVEKQLDSAGTSSAPAPDCTSELVRRRFLQGFCGEAPSVADVATELGMSARTLRRRLEAEGTSYQRLLDETRFALAEEHLARGKIAHAELAFVLGFSEASAFHRAFRRWTGTTPGAYVRGQQPSRR